MKLISDRSGKIVHTLRGYDAFVPAKLPPDPPITIDEEMLELLSDADNKLGRLDGVTQIIPNPELFVAMYVKKEAVLSAQIEGTQASLADVLNEASENDIHDYSPDGVKEVVNYVNAMDWGLQRLRSFPLSLRLIRDIHAVLLQNVRGAEKMPGEFRTTQNWIGPAGCTLNTAVFVPPEPAALGDALSDLEVFFYYDKQYIPPLIKIALIHAQFETIHPFLDGNGRMGRLLITFWLCQQKILSQPLLYLSYYFKTHRIEYYDLLMKVRLEGDWESWIKFFLRGISVVSDEAAESAKAIIALQKQYTDLLSSHERSNGNYTVLLATLFKYPIITKKEVARLLHISPATAGNLVDTFCKLGILFDDTPEKQRYKRYVFKEYFEILRRGTDLN